MSPTVSSRAPSGRTPPGSRDEPGLEESRHTLWGIVGRVAIIVMVLGIIVMWLYAFLGKQDVPGRLADNTFPVAAQPICQSVVDKIASLPKAHQTPNSQDRSDVVDRGSDQLDQLLVDLRARVPSAQPQRDSVSKWLDDWAIYVTNRRDYTKRLRQDTQARLYVTQSDRDKTQITKAVDHFADVNKMPACKTPDDVS